MKPVQAGRRRFLLGGVLLAAASALGAMAAAQGAASDALPSWNEGAAKKSITDFVARVTTEGSPDSCITPTTSEWAYDRASHIGTLDKALDEAAQRGWTVVDMKADWKTIYPPE